MVSARGRSWAAAAWSMTCLMLVASSSAARSLRRLQQAQTVGASGASAIQPFSSIVTCVPFTLMVAPSGASDQYNITTDYNEQVAASVVYSIQADTLYVDVGKDFESATPIQVTIALPADKLLAVTNAGIADVVIAPGFSTSATTLSNPGTGNVVVSGITTQQLNIYNDGTGNIFADGQLASVALSNSGTGHVVLSGADKITGGLEGTGNLYVNAPSVTSDITVDATGVNMIYYTQGTCTLGQVGIAECVQSTAADFPTYSAEWTCGIHVEGAQACSANAVPPPGADAAGRRRLSSINSYGTVITSIECTAPPEQLQIPIASGTVAASAPVVTPGPATPITPGTYSDVTTPPVTPGPAPLVTPGPAPAAPGAPIAPAVPDAAPAIVPSPLPGTSMHVIPGTYGNTNIGQVVTGPDGSTSVSNSDGYVIQGGTSGNTNIGRRLLIKYNCCPDGLMECYICP